MSLAPVPPGVVRRPTSLARRFALAAAVGLACIAVLLATSPMLPITWDEGNAIERARGVRHWFGRWQGPWNQTAPLSAAAIRADWRYTTQIEGHPPLYGLLIAAGDQLGRGWLAPLDRARLGAIVLFGLAMGAMFHRMAATFGWPAGAGAVVCLMSIPRVFAHAHLAGLDGPLTATWVLTWAAFTPGGRRGWSLGWGAMLGLTLAAKATGWFAPFPFIAWALWMRDRQALRYLPIGLGTALAVFLLLNPPLWHDPLGGLATFVSLSADRGAHRLNVATQFFGRMYDLEHPLPWYNTLAWTGMAVPVGTLLLAGIGVVAAIRRRRTNPAGLLLVGNWLVLLVVRAIPGTPVHDGIRLFLPAFAFLAALGGVGCTAWTGGGVPGAIGGVRRRAVRWVSAAVLLAGSAGSVFWYAPQWLSHYNLFAGGLPGAAAMGMEPTYYWDALDGEVLAWLNINTPPGSKVAFSAISRQNLALLRAWGKLRPDWEPSGPGEYAWYVLQHRPSGWTSADRWLLQNASPVYTKTIRSGGWGPWRLDVPLVSVYRYTDYRAATRFDGRTPAGSSVAGTLRVPSASIAQEILAGE